MPVVGSMWKLHSLATTPDIEGGFFLGSIPPDLYLVWLRK
jgi:hypothetical protein